MNMSYFYDGLVDGTVGQFAFPIQRYFSPSPFYRDITRTDLPISDTVTVRVQTQNRILFEGAVPQTRLDYVLALAKAVRFLPAESGAPQYVAIGIGPRVVWSGNLAQSQTNSIVSCLQNGRCEIWPAMDYVQRARYRPRVLLGVAATGVGYALGGLPGAAVGAAASFFFRRPNEARLG